MTAARTNRKLIERAYSCLAAVASVSSRQLGPPASSGWRFCIQRPSVPPAEKGDRRWPASPPASAPPFSQITPAPRGPRRALSFSALGQGGSAMTINDALATRRIAPRCSACGEKVPNCGKTAVAVVCSSCTHKAPENYTPQPRPERPCPDCGASLEARQRYCRKCAAARRRASTRAAVSSKRENRRHNLFSEQGYENPKSGVGPVGPSGNLTAYKGDSEGSGGGE